MQNIDPIYLLGPAVTIAFSVFLVLYWDFRHRFRGSALTYSFAAYVLAIALKYAVQIPTAKPFVDTFGAARGR